MNMDSTLKPPLNCPMNGVHFCELIKKWKRAVPKPFQALQIVGYLTYWGMRLSAPWIKRLPEILGIQFPNLKNHFFVLGTDPIVKE